MSQLNTSVVPARSLAPPVPQLVVWLKLKQWYAYAAIVSLVLALVTYRVDQTDIRIPFLYEDDALLILPMVKATMEGGTHWRTEHLGGWAGQDMHDFPVIDHFHFGIIYLMGLVFRDPALVFNLYYLLTYPLTAITAMAVLRHFGLSNWAAATGGVLYAMTPYHLFRCQNHYFLSAYYVIPVTLMLILEITRHRWPFFVKPERFEWKDRYTLGAILIAVITACAGAYYAFFACALFVAAGLYSSIATRNYRALISSFLIIGIIVGTGVVNHLPTFWYQYKYGRHTAPTERIPEEAEYYGMKIAQLLLPIEDHSLRTFANIKSMYNSFDRPAQSLTERYSLGLLGSMGFLLLVARSVLPLPHRWPMSPLAAITLAAVMVGTIGGFGALFSHLISPQVRCYNRIAIYIAFLCLFALLFEIEQILPYLQKKIEHRWGARWANRATALIWIAIGWLGIWDQTPYDWASERSLERIQLQQERYRTDAEYFHEIEKLLNPTGEDRRPMVFQLPYVRWPESTPVHQLACYEHVRGYLHTQTISWSFGCMQGREVDEWYRQMMTYINPANGNVAGEQLLEHVVRAGFEGLLLDKRGYTGSPEDPRRDARENLHRNLLRVLGGGTTQIIHPDGLQVFLDLRPYRDAIRQGRDWESEQWYERNAVQVLWLQGFKSFREPGEEWKHRWCGPKGTAVFINPLDVPVTRRASFHLRSASKDPAIVQIRGGDLWTEDIEVDRNSDVITREFVIPPGRHTVHFRCEIPTSHIFSDPRRLSFFLAGFKLE